MIANWPKRHQYVFSPSNLKCTYKPNYTLRIVQTALTGLAGREHHKFSSLQVKPLGFQAIEDAIIVGGALTL